MILKCVVFASLLCFALAQRDTSEEYDDPYETHHRKKDHHGNHEDSYDKNSYKDPYHKKHSNHDYHFGYDIDGKDHYGNPLEFGHHEWKTGKRVDGHYYVLLPSGVLQKVTYYVDGHSGFKAKVENIGDPVYPKPKKYHSHHDDYNKSDD